MSHFMDWLNAPVGAANRRDQAANLAALAVEQGLAFDADGWDYPSFNDADGRIVLGRTGDLCWRFFADNGYGPSYATAGDAFRARPQVKP